MTPFRSPVLLCRQFRGAAVAALAAAACLVAGISVAGAADLVDAAGRRVALPAHADRILPADPGAEVLVYVLAPDRLAGLARRPLLKRPGEATALAWGPASTPAEMAATAERVRADLIIDASPVTPARAAFADQVQQLAHIPYVLVDDSFARMPAMLRSLGAALEVPDRADDVGLYAEHAIAELRGQLLIRAPNTRPRVYYALGYNGLTTALPGSPAGEAIDEAGAVNVATGLGRDGEVAVSLQQLLAWNPDIIIAERRSFFNSVRHSPTWRQLAAVRKSKVYLEPDDPFGWIDEPDGVNRLIGLYWLSNLFYPDAEQEDLRGMTCNFYDKFYKIKLTNAQLEAMVRPAGAPPTEASQPITEPLVGLGAAPPAALPPSASGGPEEPTPAAPPKATARTPATPAPGTQGEIGSITGFPQTGGGPNATCTVPGANGTSPQPLSETPSTSGASPDGVGPQGLPGVPPPGRRGRPPGY